MRRWRRTRRSTLSRGLSPGLPQRRIDDDEDIDALDAPDHVRKLVWAYCVLDRREGLAGLKLRDRAHGLGFEGHFLTKSRRYSTAMRALRKVGGPQRTDAQAC